MDKLRDFGVFIVGIFGWSSPLPPSKGEVQELRRLRGCFFLVVVVIMSCQGGGANGKSATAVGPHFEFGKVGASGNNWCFAKYPDAVMINAEPSNVNQRYFMLEDGVYKVVIELGTTAAAFVLNRTSNGNVQIYTSDHFPECLSKQDNFRLEAGARTFKYDNTKHIEFTAEMTPSGTGDKISLALPAEMQFGLTVKKCTGCQ
jgi:hypothetical protein